MGSSASARVSGLGVGSHLQQGLGVASAGALQVTPMWIPRVPHFLRQLVWSSDNCVAPFTESSPL